MKRSVWLMALALVAGSVWAKTVVIDVRTPQEFAQDHIAGALNIDYTVIAQEISRASVSKEDTVILYCRSGNRSGIAQNTLKQLGYLRAENYGGIAQARQRLQIR